jgi:creatinine amidohydrolase
MRIDAMNWMQVEARAAVDDRCIIPLGSTEQHAYLSLATDTILASRVAEEAAAPLGIPVFPALPYGMVSTFLAYPGTVSLKLSTYLALVGDLLDSVHRSGFRRIVLVNGHGGNSPVTPLIGEWLAEHTDAQVKLHDWWRAPQVWAKVMATDREASHASWMENFPWTRLADVAMPSTKKPEIDRAAVSRSNPAEKRRLLGDGNFYGLYQRPDEDMLAIWQVAVAETRDILDRDWA